MPYWRHPHGTIKTKSALVAGDHIAIIGPYGNVWHDGTFPTAEAAVAYLTDFWRGHDFDPTRWRLACATVTIEAVEPSFPLTSAGEAGTATTVQQGVVHEHATAATSGGDAQPQSGVNRHG